MRVLKSASVALVLGVALASSAFAGSDGWSPKGPGVSYENTGVQAVAPSGSFLKDSDFAGPGVSFNQDGYHGVITNR